MSRYDKYAMSFAALNLETVTEGHAGYCRENGHATNITDGVRDIHCPRCGDHAWKFCASCFGPIAVGGPDVCESCEPTGVDTSGPRVPAPPAEPVVIEMRHADLNEAGYGIVFRSAADHHINGAKHNRGALFEITVWLNVFRPNPHPVAVWKGVGMIGGPGKYLGSDNKGTDEPYSVTTSAQASVISAHPIERTPVGATLKIGQAVILKLPNHRGDELGPFIVTDRMMADPHLVPVQ